MKEKTESLILVDSQDQVIGESEKMAAHTAGLLHRAFSVFVVRQKAGQWELLLQQRHSDKYHSGGLWSNTCCGHPRPEEETMAAAQRRLLEEMGFSVPLTPAGIFTYRAECGMNCIEHEIDHVFIGYYEGQPILPNPQEVIAIEWKLIAAVQADTQKKAILQYTPWFFAAFNLILPKLT